jgi:DNA-binding CsgD family transcriptional regulator
VIEPVSAIRTVVRAPTLVAGLADADADHHDRAMAAVRSQRFVGREGELAALRAAADRALTGAPTVVVVEGEAGIGKSRLVAEFTEGLRHSGVLVATGHGVDLAGGALPYGVVAGLIRDLRTRVGTHRIIDILGSRAAAVGSLDPTFSAPGQDDADRHRVFEAVQHLIAELARDEMVCLVLEDTHWADATSLDLVTFLASTVGSGRLILVATTRPDGASRLARLVALGELLSLGPLAENAMRELAANLTAPPGPALMEQIITLGEGIPLYVEELIAVQAASPSGVPGALALTFTARLAGLSHMGRQALDAVAVAEGDVPAELLRKVLRTKRSATSSAIDEAASRGLLDVLDQGRVRFHHELLRRAVADALSPLIRAEWHRRWALTLQRLDDVQRADPTMLAALAHHWFQAGDPTQAVPTAVAAGQAASAIGAATESALHWHRALLHWHRARDPEGSTGLSHEAALIEGTTVLRLAGAYADLHEFLSAERARAATSDGVLRLWLDGGLALTSGRLGETRPQVVPREQLELVLDRLSTEPKRPLVRATLFWLWWDAYDAEPHVIERILDLLDEQSDPSALPSDVVGIGLRRARFALTYGDAEGALRIVQDVLSREDALHPVNQRVVEGLHVWLLFVLGRFQECIEVGELALARLGSPALAGMNWAGIAENLAAGHAMTGNLDRAEGLMRTVLDLGDLYVHITTGCDLLTLLVSRGRADEARELLPSILEQQLPGPGEAGFRFGITSQVVAARAALSAHNGDLGAARDLLQPVLVDPHLSTDSEYLWSVVLDASRLFDEPPGIEPLDQRARWTAVVQEAAARLHEYGALGPVWRADVTAHLDRALGKDTAEQWTLVIEGWQTLGAPIEAALATLRLAERLAQDGDRDRAATTASSALATAEGAGALALADRIRAAARRHRLRLQGVEPDDNPAHRLTAREREVLMLLAQGRTNHQIADGLFMSPKTASVHVSRIITKLGVANRTEAAAYAHRHGLTSSPKQAR